MKVSELYKENKEREYKNKIWNVWRQVSGRNVYGVEEEWSVFKEKYLSVLGMYAECVEWGEPGEKEVSGGIMK